MKARRLIDEAAELGDLGDVYHTQLELAQKAGRGVLRQPVHELLKKLEHLALRLRQHVPCVEAAKSGVSPVGLPLGLPVTGAVNIIVAAERASRGECTENV